MPSQRDDYSSLTMVRRLLNGDMPAVPKLWVSAVDVRDVAAAHMAAIDLPPPAAAEQRRYILDNGKPLWMTARRRRLEPSRLALSALPRAFRHTFGSSAPPLSALAVIAAGGGRGPSRRV